MTTPKTAAGKLLLIVYGLFGCSGAILFFNLFLERMITLLTHITRRLHELDLRRKGLSTKMAERRPSGVSTLSSDNLDDWKPPVYYVMALFFVGSTVVALCASAVYQQVEQWSFIESIYFCFVTFATIGFGDYVISQQLEYSYATLYRLGNFVFLVLGCCFTYSLLQVISIVIKKMLNALMRKLECRCSCLKSSHPTDKTLRQRRNALAPHGRMPSKRGKGNNDDNDLSPSHSYHDSVETVSIKDFLQCNKITLAIMQKQLYETAQRGAIRSLHHDSGLFHDGVGPLAMLNRKLGEQDA